MTKTTEKKFRCNVNYQFDISLEDGTINYPSEDGKPRD